MKCKHCGSEISGGTGFCSGCGVKLEETAVQQPASGISIGYSEIIKDPAFERYIKNTNRWSLIFSVVLALVAIVGFFIWGQRSSEMGNPQALFVGFAIGGMFFLIGLFSVIARNRSKTWDGEVVDKKSRMKTRRTGDDDQGYQTERYMEYTVTIREDNGKKHKIVKENNALYNYYEVGDKVRHHAGLRTYEKYDKTKDSTIFCNACGSPYEITVDVCKRCKCPLLK